MLGGNDDKDVKTRLAALVRSAVGPGAQRSPAEVVMAVQPADIAHFLHPRFEPDAQRIALTTGLGASPGAASGAIVLSADEAVAAADRHQPVILVRAETGPDDVLGMQSSRGVLTARGGLASHAALVARGWGIPAVVGAADVVIEDDTVRIAGRTLRTGDWLSIDGGTGEVHLGGASVTTEDAPPELNVVLEWADRIRAGVVAVRANADTEGDARLARQLGGEGIGLCRTEHMFLADDRLPLVRRLILSDDPTEQTAALAALEEAQYGDFERIFLAMDGLPVTVRLLDPPLHEFLPDLEPLIVAEASDMLDEAGKVELAAVRRLSETNPMIGTRGVRLAVMKPGLYQMQVRAMARAVAALDAAGRSPHVEIMIPLVVETAEMRAARGWVDEAMTAVASGDVRHAFSIGAMIETPRAALVAGEMASVTDFFSFGTNDLTQLTYAFSRDDVEHGVLPRYLAGELLSHNPFETIDTTGVGRLVQLAAQEARKARPTMKLGACGEQAGDPASIRFFVANGLDYVSCSPYRVPIARLAVAQALLEAGLVDPAVLPSPDHLDVGTSVPTSGAAPSEHRLGEETDPVAVRRLVLHALAVKGFATAEVLAEIAGLHPDTTQVQLETLVVEGAARHIQARGLWQLLPRGKAEHAAELPGITPDTVAALHESYGRFLPFNADLKDLCTRWQTRAGQPNDHTDAGYDGERVRELVELTTRVEPVIKEMGSHVPRLARYWDRLAGAAAAVAQGQTNKFTGVMCGSYHDIWMELHQDLLFLLSIDRVAEGSF
jgi:phosphoenolpyruvate-protein kinase (PTS system EI component)